MILFFSRKSTPAIRNIDVVTASHQNVVTKYAAEHGLRHSHKISADCIRREKYDLGVVVSYGYLLPADVISAFPLYVLSLICSSFSPSNKISLFFAFSQRHNQRSWQYFASMARRCSDYLRHYAWRHDDWGLHNTD